MQHRHCKSDVPYAGFDAGHLEDQEPQRIIEDIGSVVIGEGLQILEIMAIYLRNMKGG